MKSFLLAKHKKISLRLDNFFILCIAIFSLKSVFLAFDISHILVPLGYFCVLLSLFVLYYYCDLKFEKEEFKLLILPSIYWLFGYLHPAGEYKIMFDLLNLLITCTFIILPKRLKCSVFRCFYWIVQLLNVISILVYVAYIFNIPIGFEKVYYYSSDAQKLGKYYIKWHMFAIYNEFIVFNRLCGIFNEPGGLGTLCALLFILVYSKSSIWEKALLIITGVLTTSLAFFVLVIGYIYSRKVFDNKNYLLLLFILFPIFLCVPKIDFGNATLNNFAKRLEVTENGLRGNNRTSNEFDEKYNEFKNSKFYYFGYGQGKSLAKGSSSYKNYIVWFGIIGASVLAICWFLLSFSYAKMNVDCLFFMVFFFISIYQRPLAIISIYGYVLTFGGISWLQAEKNGKLNER